MKTVQDLEQAGFDVQAVNHAMAVLTKDFPEPLSELCATLLDIQIADVELIKGGGGEAPATQRLRRALTELGWLKRKIVIRKTVDQVERHSITHEIDHMRKTCNGSIALEIEWNNKDPFFDRDLDNFQRLHSEGAISVGVIVTRGSSLQENMIQIVTGCAIRCNIQKFEDVETEYGVTPTPRQRNLVKSDGDNFAKEWAKRFVQDKFGQATTHWNKLQAMISRGVGNPCPLLLIGIPVTVVYHKD